ncbi:MAG: MMPL family transporter [Pirellulales bacterium]
MFEWLLNFLDRHRRAFQAACLAGLIASALLAARVRILDSPEKWMPLDSIRAWEVFSSHFDVGDMVAIGLHFRRPVRDDDLAKLKALRSELERIEGLKLVYDASLVAERIEGVPLTTLLDPQQSRRFSVYAGALWDLPSGPRDGRTLMTVCELKILPNTWDPSGNPQVNAVRRRVVREIQQVIAARRDEPQWEDVEFHVASGIVMMTELERRARQVAFTFLPASIAVGLASLLWGFRSPRALVTAVAAGGFAMLLVLGWVGARDGSVGVLTMAAPTLMAIVATASTVHFASYVADGPRGKTVSRATLVRHVAVPCLGAAATTGCGFLMLCFNQLGPIRDLGIQLFAGSLLAFFGVFAMSQLLPIRRARAASLLTHERLRRLAGAATARPHLTLALTAALSAAFVFFAWPRPADQPIGLYVDTDAFSFFSDEQPISRALAHFSSRNFGVYQLDVVLIPTQRGGADSRGKAAEQRADDEATARFSDAVSARSDLGVVRVLSTPAFRRRQAEFTEELARARREEGLGSYLASLARIPASAAIFADTFQNWNRDKLNEGAQRLTFLVNPNGAGGLRPLVDFVEARLPRDRFDCYVSGSIADSVTLAERITQGIGWGMACSVALMMALSVLLFRSLKLATIAVLPNIVPVLGIFGLMGLFKLPISSGSAMVSTVALGIAMNDTIHFMLRYRGLTRGAGQSTELAVRRTIEDLGRPIVLTSVVHIAGFSIFLLTDFQPLYHFGILAAAAMAAALVSALVLLPNLLLVFDRHPGAAPIAVQEKPRPLAEEVHR